MRRERDEWREEADKMIAFAHGATRDAGQAMKERDEARADVDQLFETTSKAIQIIDGIIDRIDWTDQTQPELLRKLCEHLLAYVDARDELKCYLDAAHYKTCNAELRAEVERLREDYLLELQQVLVATRERDEARAEVARLKDECLTWAASSDVYAEKLSDWENAAKHVEAEHPDEVHCGCVPILRKLLTDARKERDTARKFARVWKRLARRKNLALKGALSSLNPQPSTNL